MRPDSHNVLLVNPWIYDFAAYDFWNKPLGLLTIGAILHRLGYDVQLIDCLDRFDPALPPSAVHSDGSGKFHREPLEPPANLRLIPRQYSRYGWPAQMVEERLGQMPTPAAILITSFMTYWYPAVADMVRLLRRFFPKSPVILGGIYATLCPDHARACIRPDYLITGEGEEAAVRLVAQLCDGPGKDYSYAHLDELPFPLYEKYPVLHSIALLTSRGCPHRCSYCASHLLTRGYRRRSVDHVVHEVQHWRETRQVNQIAFFDDALLFQAEQHCKPLLRRLIELNPAAQWHTPNGLQVRYLDAEVARLMRACGFVTLRLSFESVEPSQQQNKVSTAELERALAHLEGAGFARERIGVYVMMGLAGQTPEQVQRSVDFVHRLGARVNLASYSPIPGTVETALAQKQGWWAETEEPALANNSLYPLWRKKYGFALCQEIVNYARSGNERLTAKRTQDGGVVTAPSPAGPPRRCKGDS
ncbi:radical SAM protein [bacterium]|nr:radical SAM protein [bacterium]